MKSMLRTVNDHGVIYQALMFVCPGCSEMSNFSGIHILPVNSETKTPSWEWNGLLDIPSLSPSLMTHQHNGICHSFLFEGVFDYLSDSTHSLSGKQVEMVDLPNWVLQEEEFYEDD